MKLIKISGVVCFVAIMLFASSCDRRDQQLGPSLNEIFGDFEVVEPFSLSRTSVNFADGERVIFRAKFATLEEWKVTITGQNSGAVKEITGFGTTLDESTARWIGDATILPIFQAENCLVTLSIVGQPDTFQSSLTITGPKLNDGVLVTGFESGVSPNWPFFYQSGVFFFPDNGSPAGQGNFFLNASGTVGWDFLIGLIEFPAEFTTGTTHFDLGENPNQVYFNVMLGGESSKPNSFAIFRFREDDNGDGVWDGDTEDMWSTENIFLTWDGWQLYSVPYSELILSAGGAGSTGNQVPNPDKILSVEYLLLSDPELGAARGNLDYLIFTENGPLRP